MGKVNKDAPPHYLVTVEGSFAYKDDQGVKARKNYHYEIPVPVQVTAKIPVKKFEPERQRHYWEDEVKTLHIADYGILSYLIRENRIQNKIRREYPGFLVLLRHEIVDLRGSSPDVVLPSDPHVLNKNQLIKFIKANRWPIDLILFNTLKDLREAVLNYREAPESYELYETMRRRRSAQGNAFTAEQEILEELYASKGKEETSVDDVGHLEEESDV